MVTGMENDTRGEFYRLEGLIYRPAATTPMTMNNASRNLRIRPERWPMWSRPVFDTKG